MKLHSRHRRILASLQYQPRKRDYFTHSSGPEDTRCSSTVMYAYFAHLEAEGYIVKQDDDTYIATRKGSDALHIDAKPTAVRQITNATMSKPYRTPEWYIRPGGEDHKQWQSFGQRC